MEKGFYSDVKIEIENVLFLPFSPVLNVKLRV